METTIPSNVRFDGRTTLEDAIGCHVAGVLRVSRHVRFDVSAVVGLRPSIKGLSDSSHLLGVACFGLSLVRRQMVVGDRDPVADGLRAEVLFGP